MSSANSEIQALLQLIDDPDQEVFDMVANKILYYGSGIIPNLESLWEETPDQAVQERLEMLIHRVHYQNLQTDFKQWNEAGTPDLLTGALLTARYQYPGLSDAPILQEIKKIERNIWLELNNYLTPLEKINVLNSMIYSYFGMKGSEIAYGRPRHFFINNVVESHKGNAITIGILYLALCQRLDIPIFAVKLPRQFILGYYDSYDPFSPFEEENLQKNPRSCILFYVDPLQGQIYTGDDVEIYLRKLNIPSKDLFFQPRSAREIIHLLLNELSLCYENKKEHYRYEELRNLAAILEE